MARREVRIKLSYIAVVDDGRDGVPWVNEKDIAGFALNGCKTLNGLTEIKDIKLDLSLTRESTHEMLVRAGIRKPKKR